MRKKLLVFATVGFLVSAVLLGCSASESKKSEKAASQPKLASQCENFYTEYKARVENLKQLIVGLATENWGFVKQQKSCVVLYTANMEEACSLVGICTTPEQECSALERSANFQVQHMPDRSFSAEPSGGWKCDVALTVKF